MRFRFRFAYYMFGFAMGLFFVAMIWSGKDARCNYFPNARVLNDLRNKPFQFSDKALLILSQKWVDTADIRKTLTYGDVDFDKSNKQIGKGKLYIIEGKTSKNQSLILQVTNYSDKAVLEDIIKTK
ncbi:MAG TPA: DUF4258 domain-containing protein [Flavobacterium sp.]|nr:DUF4258 domain-containing protein [Flavobacterium sp.]